MNSVKIYFSPTWFLVFSWKVFIPGVCSQMIQSDHKTINLLYAFTPIASCSLLHFVQSTGVGLKGSVGSITGTTALWLGFFLPPVGLHALDSASQRVKRFFAQTRKKICVDQDFVCQKCLFGVPMVAVINEQSSGREHLVMWLENLLKDCFILVQHLWTSEAMIVLTLEAVSRKS